MRKLQTALLVLLIIITGCKKEEIITITKSTGKVIERSTNAPLSGIKVAVSNGQRDLVTTTTDAEGRFEFTVDFDKVTADDSLLLDGRPYLPSKKYELKGIGKAEYDYGTLWLYDKSDAMYLPQVTTDSIISVDTTSAVLACTVKSDGGFTVTKRGICYATRQLPDFSDNVKPSSGSGTGAYICEIGNLIPATGYYYRAFAINAIDTVYGEQKSFRTLAKTYSVYVSASPSNGGEVTGGGVFEEGSTQTVVATANNGYTFINWTKNGNEVSTNTSYSFTLNGNRTLVAHFQVKTYTVTTSSNPVNGGSTTGGGTFNHSQSCTLRAMPTEDYTFLRWTKNGTQVSTEPNYTFDVTESGNYVAHFTNQPLTFTVSVSANPSNGGTVTGGGTYEMGQTCTVRATANSGYVFANWTENGTVVSEQANYTFPVAGNRTLKANYTVSQNAYTINVSANPTNGGTVTGGGSFNQGQSCTVTATPNTGFVFVKWTENGNKVSDNPNYTFTVSGNRTLVAQFQMVTYTVSTSSNPSNGGVTSGGGTYQQGQQCTVTATANAGYSFTNWTENGNVISSDASYTFTVNSNRSLVANFALQTYTISVSANPSNGGGVSGGGTYSYGQSCTVTATVADGFNFANWTENGNAVSSNASYTFTVTGNRTLVASFMAIPEGAIAGLFTINNNGDKVYFSQGNLQYQASTDTWRFAENQWDYVGTDNSNISSTYSGWIDLFGWGTSGYHNPYDNFNVNYQPWSTSTATVNTGCNTYGYGPSTNMPDPNLTGTSAEYDWGVHNAISNGGNHAGLWRTLTTDEWLYVFNTRTASTVGGTANARFAKATVNGKAGVILFPDMYAHPSYLPSPLQVNNTKANFTVNSFSGGVWTAMEDLGCVFLPATGYRNGTSVGGVGSYGYYWSASYIDSGNSYFLLFDSDFIFAQGYYGFGLRCYGLSVRLVCPAR